MLHKLVIILMQMYNYGNKIMKIKYSEIVNAIPKYVIFL